MIHSSKVLYDTDFLISLFIKTQSTHARAMQIFQHIKTYEPFILNLVKYELATVLSHKFSQQAALDILQELNTIALHSISLKPEDEKTAWQKFYKQQKKGTSFVDCANLVMAEKLHLQIASFDQFYPQKILVST